MYLESINNSIEEIKEHSEDLYQKLIDKGEWIFDIVQKKKVNKLIERIETRSAKKNDYYSLIVETKPEELYNFLDRNFIDKQILDCLCETMRNYSSLHDFFTNEHNRAEANLREVITIIQNDGLIEASNLDRFWWERLVTFMEHFIKECENARINRIE